MKTEFQKELEQIIGRPLFLPPPIRTIDEDKWITVENGEHVLLGEGGEIKGGMGGKFNGKKMGSLKKSKPVNMKSLEDNLSNYVGGGYSSVKDAVTPEEFDYILDNMTDTDRPLYRIERSTFTLDKQNLKEGSTFEFEDNLRSFTRSEDYAKQTVEYFVDESGWDDAILFKTKGTVKQFSMDKYAQNYYEDQSESLSGGKFIVDNISNQRFGNNNIKVVTIKKA